MIHITPDPSPKLLYATIEAYEHIFDLQILLAMLLIQAEAYSVIVILSSQIT
jgi:hypothetical protein